MATTLRMQPITWYMPIERLDEEKQIVEGYCFVNETVRGEGGVRLKRSAMEAATADYMKFHPLREMHQPSAAGNILSLEWDDKGCYCRAEVVDPVAWLKCQKGVYKGFSVGVNPRIRRGMDITEVDWIENSLVDSPKDRDAVFALFRAAGREFGAEVEVLVLDEDEPLPVRRGEVMTYTVTSRENQFILRAANGDEWGVFDTEEEAITRGDAIVERAATDAAAAAASAGNGTSDPGGDAAGAGDTGTGGVPDTSADPAPQAAADGVGSGADGAVDGSGVGEPNPAAGAPDAPGAAGDAAPAAEPAGATEEPAVGRAAGTLDHGADNDDADHARNMDSDHAPARENLEGRPCHRGEGCCMHCSDGSMRRTEPAADPRDGEEEHLLRVTRLETDNAELLTRAETAETSLTEVRAELERAAARVTALENEPAPVDSLPVRFYQGVDRDFLVNRNTELGVERMALETELKTLMETPLARTASPEDQNLKAARINVLRQQITRLNS
jgi:hypothetical protein